MALLACLCTMQHLFAGDDAQLRTLIAGLIHGYGPTADDLRPQRLHRNGIIQRIPRPASADPQGGTPTGRLLQRTLQRILNPSLAELDPHFHPRSATDPQSPASWRAFERAIENIIRQAAIAARS